MQKQTTTRSEPALTIDIMIAPKTRKRFFVAYDAELKFVASDMDYGRLFQRVTELAKPCAVEIDSSLGVSSDLYEAALNSLPAQTTA